MLLVVSGAAGNQDASYPQGCQWAGGRAYIRLQVEGGSGWDGSVAVMARVAGSGLPKKAIVGTDQDGNVLSSITNATKQLVEYDVTALDFDIQHTAGTQGGYSIAYVVIDQLRRRRTTVVVDQTVASVTVTPSPLGGDPGDVVTVTAVAKNAAGQILSGKTFTAVSSDPTKATIGTIAGNQVPVTMVAVGTAAITVTCDGIDSAPAVATVAYVVTEVDVSPTVLGLNVGDTATLTATVKNHRGDAVPGATVSWASDDPSVASVDSGGVVTAVAAGSATITATSVTPNAGVVSNAVATSVTSVGGFTELAFDDFNSYVSGVSDGGPFSFGIDPSVDPTFTGLFEPVDDWTGLFPGEQWLQINYNIGNHDDLGPLWDHLFVTPGSKWAHSWYEYFPFFSSASGDIRKISYAQSAGVGTSTIFVVPVIRTNGDLAVELGSIGPLGDETQTHNSISRLIAERVYRFEEEITFNSAPGVPDGKYELRIWGMTVLSLSNVVYLQTADDGMHDFFTGYQQQVTPDVNEFRRLKNLAFDSNLGRYAPATPTEVATVTDLFPDQPTFDGAADSSVAITVEALNKGGQSLTLPTLSVSSSDESVATAEVSGGVVTITRVAAGSATITVSALSGSVSVAIPGTVTAAYDILGALATSLGGDANFLPLLDFNRFASSRSIVSGELASWADARGGVSPKTFVFSSGNRPAGAGGDGFVFAGSEFSDVLADDLGFGTDNIGLIAVGLFTPSGGPADVHTPAKQDIVAFVGDPAADGFGMTTFTDGLGDMGALLGGVAWVSSSQVASDLTAGKHVFMAKREGGTTSFALDAGGLGGASSATPNAPTARAQVGWDGVHGKFEGTLYALVFVNLDAGSGAIEAAMANLRTAYGLS